MALVHDYPSIAQIMNRKVQKADFEAKNPEPSAYGALSGGMFGIGTPFELPDLRGRVFTGVQTGGTSAAGRLTGGSCETKTLLVANLPTAEQVREARLEILRRWFAADAKAR